MSAGNTALNDTETTDGENVVCPTLVKVELVVFNGVFDANEALFEYILNVYFPMSATLSGHLVTIYLYSSSAPEYKLKSDFMSTFNRGYGGQHTSNI